MKSSVYTKDNPISYDATFSIWITYGRIMLIFAMFALFLFSSEECSSEEKTDTSQTKITTGMKLTKAVICEEIKDGQPVNDGAIFSSDLESIICYTEFYQITKKTTIYHCWYFNNNLISKKMPLILNPPRWSTFSQIQPRDTDKGPWRVEIVDQDGNILQTLRFSIVD